MKLLRSVSFEACCQWALLSVQITRLVTLPYYLLYRSTFYPCVSKVHAGFFHVSVIHWSLTGTTGSLTCIHGHSYACVCTPGLGTPTSHQNIFDSEKLKFVLCSWLGLNLVSLNLESDTTNWATPSAQSEFYMWSSPSHTLKINLSILSPDSGESLLLE